MTRCSLWVSEFIPPVLRVRLQTSGALALVDVSTRELEELVEASGFPFELAVAQEFRRIGFEIYPSHRFLNRGREREAELDLLAIQRHKLETKSGRKVEGTLRIAVESKD